MVPGHPFNEMKPNSGRPETELGGTQTIHGEEFFKHRLNAH
jgi:hypothetical protein